MAYVSARKPANMAEKISFFYVSTANLSYCLHFGTKIEQQSIKYATPCPSAQPNSPASLAGRGEGGGAILGMRASRPR